MRKRCFVPLLVIGVCFALLAADQAGAGDNKPRPDYRNSITTARELIWKAITSGQGSGATIAVMDQGKIVYSEGIGVADRSTNRPVDRNTRFNIGSSSKMFAAVAVLLLVDDGKVALDESVVRYIPEFRMKDERYKKITVRMLFNHSSGLPGSSFYFGFKPDSHAHKLLLDTMKDAHLKHDPGAMSIYCNDGFTLAEMIVERMSGRKYIDFLTERVFNPLGMKNSSASVGEISEANVAEYYDPKTGRKYPRQAVHVLGAGGLASTAEDLCRFGDSFSPGGKRILSDASIKEILRAQPARFSDKLRNRQIFGQFGWEYSSIPDFEKKGIQVLGKGGNTQFYNANLQIVPGERIAIGFAITGQASGETVTRPILNALMKDRGMMEEKAKTVKIPVEPRPVPPGMLKYAGYYIDGNVAVKIAFDKAGKSLAISQVVDKKTAADKPGSSKILFYHDGCFHDNQEGIKYYFTTVDGSDFLVSHGKPQPFEVDMIAYQKIALPGKPLRLRENINRTVWILRNAPPYMQSPVTAFPSFVYEELPGYVDFDGIKRIETGDLASIAATAFRDQTELLLLSGKGKTWAKSGFFLFSKADGIPGVKSGSNIVKIGQDNYNEWLKLDKGALLRFEKPENGRIVVSNRDAVLFDSVVDAGEIYAPAGSYVFCAGVAGDVFRIRAE